MLNPKFLLRIEGGAVLASAGVLYHQSHGRCATGASLAQAFERQDRLELHWSQGAPATFTLTNPGSAVAVRDATGKVVYLG